MQFTTTTEIARKWSKVFSEYQQAIVLNNNKNIWVIFGWELAQAILNSWVVEQIKEELWELNDKETVDLVVWYKEWKKSDSISLDDFRKKYAI